MNATNADQIGGKQRVKGPNLQVFLREVPFDEGLARADSKNLIVASNTRLDKALGSEEREPLISALPCRSGTMTAYVEPNKELGKQVEYVDSKTGYTWIFPVPEIYREEQNAILIVEHPNYSLSIEGTTRTVVAREVDIIRAFPASNGYYLVDPVYGIPVGDKTKGSDHNAKNLFRASKMVGPAARAYGDCNEIILSGGPSYPVGIIVEAPEKA